MTWAKWITQPTQGNGTTTSATRTFRSDDPERICTCGLYQTGYRESWAIQHLDSCAYTKSKSRSNPESGE